MVKLRYHKSAWGWSSMAQDSYVVNIYPKEAEAIASLLPTFTFYTKSASRAALVMDCQVHFPDKHLKIEALDFVSPHRAAWRMNNAKS